MKPKIPSLRLAAVLVFLVLLSGQTHIGAIASKPARNFAMARLLNEGERPLVGAIVQPTGVATGPSTTWGGVQPPGFPAQVVSDANGMFILSRTEPFARVRVHIDAPEVGSGDLWLDSGNVLTVIHLGPFERNQPLPMTPPQLSWSSNSAAGIRFPRPSGPPFTPGRSAWTNQLAQPGALSRSSNANAGQVTIRLCPFLPGQPHRVSALPQDRLKLAGRVETRTGEPLPSGLLVHVRSGIETEQAAPDSAGRFAFIGVPPGEVTIWLDPGMTLSHGTAGPPVWTGWRLSSINRNRRMFSSRTELVGLLEKDKDDLLLVIEQGSYPFTASMASRLADSPRRRPLWGAETSGPPFIAVSGRVVDEQTGQPIRAVKVIPGRFQTRRTPPPGSKSLVKHVLELFTGQREANKGTAVLDLAEEQIASNGTFSVKFAPLTYLPLLRLEAAGYVPLETGPIAHTTNLVVRLRSGPGPAGVVLRPDGQPAIGASVVYATGESAVLVQVRQLRAQGEKQALQVVGPDGKFAFAPGLPGRAFAADSSGWAEAKVVGAGDVLNLRLEPWAVVKGTLLTTNGTAAPGMVLALTWTQPLANGGTAVQDLGSTTTDANGAFEFQNVPSRRLELQRIAVRPGSPFGPRYPQTWLVPQPGVTNDLGRVICDPPPPLVETLKKKLGL